MQDRSRPARFRAPIGSASTTSCCASRKISVTLQAIPGPTLSANTHKLPALRILALILAILVIALQYPIWAGKGGWLKVRELDRQLDSQRQVNDRLKARNAVLDAEVRDLKHGFEAIEERARSELGMIRQDEVFFQLPADSVAQPAPAEGS